MVKEIGIPEGLNDLTLGQWQEIIAIGEVDKEFYVHRILSIVYGVKGVKIKDIKNYDLDFMSNSIGEVLKQKPIFENRFKLGNTEYGFIPNFDDITFGELVDMDDNMEQKDYHKLMSILYRPITKTQSGGRYKIEKYGGTEDLRDMPLGIALAAVGFFLELGRELVNATQNSLTEEEEAVLVKQGLVRSGVGIPASIL